jgi:hypothetical protein
MVYGLVFFMVLIVAFDIVAANFGADSRDGADWRRHP